MTKAQWIWLNREKYPEYADSPISVFHPGMKTCKYVIAEFQKQLAFDKIATRITMDISADVKFWLYVNGIYIGAGPVCAGGDYGIIEPMPWQYYNTYEVTIGASELEIYVMVQNRPSQMCDMSQGRNGLYASVMVEFDDGTSQCFGTDDSWKVRVSARHFELNKVDFTIKPNDWENACIVENVWRLRKPGIPMLDEEKIFPENVLPLTVAPGGTKEVVCYFDKIYSLYHRLKICGETSYIVLIKDFEKEEDKAVKISELIIGEGPLDFRGLSMASAGGMKLYLYNTGNEPLRVDEISGSFVHYPVTEEGRFFCSEPCLNKIFDMGKHTLKICRQTIELDSPLHQENLGCAGDYFIASLMNYYTYGDGRLTRLDIVRIGDCLKMYRGYMFHTTYGMIWIMMVYDYYMYTGDQSILHEVWEAMCLLLERMDSYTDRYGIITHPPSYMFVDWIMVDGMSLHHPPMALGQAVLNAFYYGGLTTAVKIGEIVEEKGVFKQQKCYEERASLLKASFQHTFYDEEKGLYFDGCNDTYEPLKWLPENVDKRYFSWHTNTLAVLYDIAPKAEHRRIMKTILGDMSLIHPQPYFMHFVLEAIYKAGLFQEYGIAQLLRWRGMTEFEKGLAEGWFDMSGYGFDYSHVWSGTPTYQLPSKLSGLKLIEPGFRKICLKPDLHGLQFAHIRIPTPYGFIEIKLEQGKEPIIFVPEGIEVVS